MAAKQSQPNRRFDRFNQSWFFRWFVNNKVTAALINVLLVLIVIFVFTKVSSIFDPVGKVFNILLPPVLLAFLFGQSRIFLGMARDGLLPNRLARISTRGVPVVVTVFTAIVVAFLAGIMRLDELASLANAGTLMAFMAVGVSLIVLRVREPNRERKFKAPLWWLVGGIAIVGCITFFFSLKATTQLYFLLWNLFGLAVYLIWSSRNSRLAKGEEVEG